MKRGGGGGGRNDNIIIFSGFFFPFFLRPPARTRTPTSGTRTSVAAAVADAHARTDRPR